MKKEDLAKIKNPALALLTTAQEQEEQEQAIPVSSTSSTNEAQWVDVPEMFIDGKLKPVKREVKNSRFNILTTERKGQYIRYIAYMNQQSINEVINEAIDLVITKYMSK